MEKKIEIIIKKAFNTTNFEIVHRLIGGRSNYTYVVKVNGDKYTVRIPGKNGNLFVDREVEKRNLTDVNKLKINNETVFFDVESGVKVSKFIDGEQLFGQDYPQFFPQIVELLKKVHAMPKFANDYKPFDRLAVYESFCYDLDYQQPEIYYELKDQLLSYLHFLNDDEIVSCHNDSQPSNFIVADDGVVYLTDWEFAGNNYRYYDIACFSDNSIEQALDLLDVYTDFTTTVDQKKRVILWRAFQTLQWCNVAMYKELIGLSDELHIDFKSLSFNYIKMAGDLLVLVGNLDENR